MQLTDEMQSELEIRLRAIEAEQQFDSAFKDLSAFDELAIRVLFIVAVVAFVLL